MPTITKSNGQTYQIGPGQVNTGTRDNPRIVNASPTPAPVAPKVTSPAPSSSSSTTTKLGKNITSTTTSDIQKSLGLTTDNVYGPLTTAAVKKFQRENGLVEDGIFGPKTLAAYQSVYGGGSTAASKTPSPTPAEVYKFSEPSYPNQDINTAQEDAIRYARKLSQVETDPNKIYHDTLDRFQAEINAQNSVYADKLQEAKNLGISRLGSERAIQARRGELGSTFGEAATARTITENLGNENAVINQKNAAVQSILSNARTTADAIVKERQTAKSEGLDAYIKYLDASDKRIQTNAQSAARAIAEQGLTPDELQPSELQALATGFGVTVNAIKAAFPQIQQDIQSKKSTATDKELLSPTEAATLGVPYGTTRAKAAAMGITPNRYKPTGGSGTGGAPSLAQQKTGIQKFLTTGVSPGGEKLGNARGTDGFTDPQVYIEAFNQWTGSTKDFLNYFPVKSNVNPLSYNRLPAALRPSTSGSTSFTP